MPDLEHAADRAPRHSVDPLVRHSDSQQPRRWITTHAPMVQVGRGYRPSLPLGLSEGAASILVDHTTSSSLVPELL